jgi:hypothetical protein
MKKTILLLVLCMTCIYTHAQQLDTALIRGRWELYSLRNGSVIFYRDGGFIAYWDRIYLKGGIIEYLDSTCRRGDYIIYRDSCGIKVKGEFKPEIEIVNVPEDMDSISNDSLKDVNRPIARGDSTLKDINRPKARGDRIFKTFMEFDGRGHVTALIALNNDPSQELHEEKGGVYVDSG